MWVDLSLMRENSYAQKKIIVPKFNTRENFVHLIYLVFF